MDVREILTGSGLSLRQLEEDTGLPYGTLRSWSAESRKAPTPESWQRLAAGLQARAEKLRELAQQAERAAESTAAAGVS